MIHQKAARNEDIFSFIKNFYEKNEPLNLENNFHPLIINRFLSMYKPNIEKCNIMNKYSFYIPKNLWQISMYYLIPKQQQPWSKYIKMKKVEDNKLEFWHNALKKYYMWSQRELEQNIQVIDDETKRQLAYKFGFDKTEFKKIGLEYIEKSKKKIVSLADFGLV